MHGSCTASAGNTILNSGLKFILVRLFLTIAACGSSRWVLSEEGPASRNQERVEFQDGSNEDELPEEMVRSIKELGSPVYRERQAAFLRLWKMADGGREKSGLRLIDAASRSNDIDIAASARWLKVLLSLSASPNEASKLIEDLVLIQSGDPQTILRLARSHRWDHLLAMLDVLSPADRIRLLSEADALSGVRATVLELAWEDHQESRIPEIVDHLWPVSEAIDARRLWDMLGLKEWSQQPPWTTTEATMTTLWKITSEELNQNVLNAVGIARKSGQEERANSILIAHGLWKQAIPRQADQPPPAKSITNGLLAVQAAKTALLCEWSGAPMLGQRWADAIGLPGVAEEDVDGVMLALSLCGRTEEAIAVAKIRSPDEAYECLIRQGRIDEAIHAIGIEDLDETSVQSWINKLTKTPPADIQADLEITQRLASVGCLLSRLGMKDLGSLVDQSVIQWASSIGEDHANRRTGKRFTIAEVSRERIGQG